MANDLMQKPTTNARPVRVDEGPAVVRPEPAAKPTPQRLLSLDAYRGLIMVTLAFNGFGLAATALNHFSAPATPYYAASVGMLAAGDTTSALGAAATTIAGRQTDGRVSGASSPVWAQVFHQFEHVEWAGGGYWDMIQPSFMFMVGAAMAFSYAKRRQLGDSYLRMLFHAFVRSLLLIGLGIFLMSLNRSSTDWQFMIVLAQIGLGYTFLFLLWDRPFLVQALAAVAILVGTWFLYTSYPDAGIDLTRGNPDVGISKEWAQKNLAGIPPAWHKNANVGHAIDVWVLNQFPRPTDPKDPSKHLPFVYNEGGYQTINFLPSLATMLFGLMTGELLRRGGSASLKVIVLVVAGCAGIALGVALEQAGICPIVKRIWTPAWALYSAGWCCLIMATLYTVIDIIGLRAWSMPLVVVGANSIAIYCMSMTLKSWTAGVYRTHFGSNVFRLWDWPAFQSWAPLWEPTIQATLVGLAFWLVCYYMYRNRIFIRI